MTDFNLKKKMAEQAILIADDFISSDIAKEILLKDDEKTPRQLTDRITKEIEEHLEINKFFINKLKEENLPTEIFTEEFKSNLFNKVDKIEELKSDIPKFFNVSQFNEIYVTNSPEGIFFNYKLNEKYGEGVYVKIIIVFDVLKNRDIIIGNPKEGSQIFSGTNLVGFGMLIPGRQYTFTAITNEEKRIKVEIRNK
jgi:hypothetical protein